MLKTILTLLLLVHFYQEAIAASDQLNVVFFYVDDLGWTDLGYAGSDFYKTPHIDRLAKEAMVFTDAYSNGPNCAPSRACLMSGLYSPRHGIYTVGDPRRGNAKQRRLEPVENETVLADRFITIAEALRENGYSTAAMGKWHLGADPCTQGFELNIAGREWGSPSGGGYHSPYQYPHLKQNQAGEYLTDRLTDEACRFIRSASEKPFFLYLAHYAVHTPLQAKESLKARFQMEKKGQHHRNATYAAMIQSVDQSLGKVLAELETAGISKQTIVIFTSDNGGFGGATSNLPLRGSKGMLYEGGIRVPMLCLWPGVTKPGQQCKEPVLGIDFYPTILEMTGTAQPTEQNLDGVSLVPLLRGDSNSLDRDAIFWHFPCYLQGSGDPGGGPFRTTPAGAVRMGNWKLIEWFETGHRELYDLEGDIRESVNCLETHPEIAMKLQQKMEDWRDFVQAPIPDQKNPLYQPVNPKP